ncbi:hypothetical protein C6P40_003811 [Pichia californica]|uniref:CNNM transmembrane domain-containing protein n=1 Tax=Pichia californica TaxID=460514 RepID=A0A9P7BH64_9ASCO|nr:hypothetical protein C6P42_003702 [[Candida] californica]KAG0690110.1 hypothetical protein C6P40_003811 [[Candida] californica]
MLPNRSYHYNIAKVFLSLLPTLSQALPVSFHPVKRLVNVTTNEDSIISISKHVPLTETEFYIYLITSSCLVLLGGVFAGLTLGLMGQDEVYLKVISSSGTEKERKAADKVLELLGRGKHWLLVTLLLSNVITNETLPVILDRLLGGGFAAVFSSTVAIVIFGEIIPQSICVRYGLELGAFFAPYVLILMYILYPVAYPIAKLLDYILGQDHGTLYRKSGLKTLVNLHHTMGSERLNIDEVTIISAVLDLKAKPVSEIMTPIKKVYTLPSDKILDEKTVEEIFNKGYSRIPVHLPGEPTNFVGMLLVRILISYDPEDDLPISAFPLATLPETSTNTSCLNILNYFQEGKSHMVIVSETPGRDTGAKGVLTLEDVIEELIGEEIVDESDVYIDVNKDIKRTIPGPLAKRNVTSYLHKLYSSTGKTSTASSESSLEQRSNSLPHNPGYIYKNTYDHTKSVPRVVSNIKPSNLAADPLKTNNAHITIKKQPNLDSTIASPSEHDTLKSPNSNINYGSSSPIQVEEPQIHTSEAAALVQGIYNNASRHTSKCNVPPEECELETPESLQAAKRTFLNNTYGIPVPKGRDNNFHKNQDDDTSQNASPDRGVLVEDNIVSLSGVSKTIIHDGNWGDRQ